MDVLELKKQLFNTCTRLVDEKVQQLQALIDEAQSAANNESKSVMGDKYETSRAMMHLEKEKIGQQLREVLKQKQVLTTYSSNKPHTTAQLGSVVVTDSARFYLAISLGPLLIANQQYLVISPASPIGRLLTNKGAGESISFNKITYRLLEVF